MATTTPNFSWPVPTSTDLVKDGAVAIEALGDAIDASLLDLKGGTTNQVLAKNSNTDMDFKWVADASGIPATILDAKGDLIAATAADTASRLAVGANGTVLTADSAEATGLKWAAPASASSFVGCSLYKSADQAIANATLATVSFDLEQFDTDAFHDNSTNNSRITIPSGKGGKYLLNASLIWGGSGGSFRLLQLFKNGAAIKEQYVPAVSYGMMNNMTLIVSAVATDYFELKVYQDSGGSRDVLKGAYFDETLFQAQYLGA
jgi:hypothetical protein